MPKFIVTKGSHFTPFTYEELVKPVMYMQEKHDAAQGEYDTLGAEVNALDNYISKDDVDARRLYDSYREKLERLQNNLWEHGYTAQTRRELAEARNGFAKDISRLSKAVQTRQERSKEYWDIRHKNPDMIMGADPGSSSLDRYLEDDNFGRDYYAYSGNAFMKEVGIDAQARANEMIQDPQIIRDPRMRGYLTRITQEGFTSQEVQNAGLAVRSYLDGDATGLANLDPASQILANVLINHMESSGAKDQVSKEELYRLFDYGMTGLSQAIGKKKFDDMRDLEWAEAMERDRYMWQMQAKAQADASKKAAEKEASMKLEDTETRSVTGPNAGRTNRRLHRRGYDTTTTTLLFGPQGQEVHNAVEASELVYSGDTRRRAYELLGFDIGRTPGKLTEDNYLHGVITKEVEGVTKNYRTRYNPNANGGEGAVEYSESGKLGSWKVSPGLTEVYREARKEYDDTLASYKGTDIGKLADIDPDKQYKDYDRYGVSFDTPLTDFKVLAMSNPKNSTSELTSTYVARRGTDSGKYVQKFADYISSGITFSDKGDPKRDEHRKAYKGFSEYIHPMTKYGTLEKNPIKSPDARGVFKFDDNGRITNITEIKVTPDSIIDMIDNGAYGDGYLVVKTDANKEYGVSINMMKSDIVNKIFAQARYKMIQVMDNPYLREATKQSYIQDYVKEVSYLLKDALGYSLNTVSQSGTKEEDIN